MLIMQELITGSVEPSKISETGRDREAPRALLLNIYARVRVCVHVRVGLGP